MHSRILEVIIRQVIWSLYKKNKKNKKKIDLRAGSIEWILILYANVYKVNLVNSNQNQ